MYILLTNAEEAILSFLGNTLGAVFSFIIYLFTEIQLFGINMMMVIFLLLVMFTLFWILRMIL